MLLFDLIIYNIFNSYLEYIGLLFRIIFYLQYIVKFIDYFINMYYFNIINYSNIIL